MNKGRKLAVLMAVVVAANMCSVPVDASAKKLKITNVSGTKKVMYVGKSFKIKTNFSVKKLTFKSSKTSVAKVTKKGVVKAKKVGRANITIKTTTGLKKKIKIVVKKAKTTATPTVSPKTTETIVPSLPQTTETTIPSLPQTTETTETTVPSLPQTTETVVSSLPQTTETTETTVPSLPQTTETTVPSLPQTTETVVPSLPQTTVSSSPQTTETVAANTTEPLDTIYPTIPQTTETTVQTIEPIATLTVDVTPAPIITIQPIATVEPTQTPAPTTDPKEYVEPLTAEYKEKTDANTAYEEAKATKIQLNGNSIQVDGNGAVADGSVVTITSEGTYILNGTLDDGQIIVNIEDTTDDPKVHFILNGVTIFCSNNAPMVFTSADKVIMTLAEGTINKISDSTTYNLEDGKDEPDAAIYSKVALSINGTGTLEVEGNYSKGIKTKDNLKILGGNISVISKDAAIIGRDMLGIWGGTITTNAGGDGLKSTNDEKSTKGYIYLAGGTLNITAVGDGISAETSVYIKDTDITIKETGTDTENSHKGIKAGTTLYIESGTINIDSVDDALHSDGCIKIEGGTINITCGNNSVSGNNTYGNAFFNNTSTTSGADGIHADGQVYIEDGDINITQSYEGIEGAIINIDGGNIKVKSTDDGINAADGTTGDGGIMAPGGNWGIIQTNPINGQTTTNCTLNISGGNLYVDASGDGLDANGSIYMTGGTVIVNGPANTENGALDFDNEFVISGGVLAAMGASGMAQAPGSTSSQCSIMTNISGQAGTLIHVQDEDGNSIMTLKSEKAFNSIIISTPEFVTGENYQIYTGGTIDGEIIFGTESGGIYAADAIYTAGNSSPTTVQASTAPTGNSAGDRNFGGNTRPGRIW